MEPVAQQQTPVERVFAHWVFMLGKNAARTALGPDRRRVIAKALKLYAERIAEDQLFAAIEGCAASEWHAGDNDRGIAYNDIKLILRDEEHIERFAELGYELRERLRRDAAAADKVVPIAPADPAAIAAARAALRELAARATGRRLPGVKA